MIESIDYDINMLLKMNTQPSGFGIYFCTLVVLKHEMLAVRTDITRINEIQLKFGLIKDATMDKNFTSDDKEQLKNTQIHSLNPETIKQYLTNILSSENFDEFFNKIENKYIDGKFWEEFSLYYKTKVDNVEISEKEILNILKKFKKARLSHEQVDAVVNELNKYDEKLVDKFNYFKNILIDESSLM